MHKRTRKEMKRDSWQCYEGMSTHCKKSAKKQFKRPTAYETMRQAKEDDEQEKYLAEWNRRLKERKKRKDERN